MGKRKRRRQPRAQDGERRRRGSRSGAEAERSATSGGGRPGRKAWLIAAGVVVLLAAGIGAQRLLFSERLPLNVPPNPDRGGMETQVADKLLALRQRVEREPRSARAWGELGMNFDVHGLKQEAVLCYKQAATLQPQEFRWPYYCAIVLREIGSPEAFEWFERSRALNPDYGPLHLRHAQALFDAGLLEESERAYRRSITADDELSQPHLGLGRIALARGDLEAGRGHLLRALEIEPTHGAARGVLGEVYRRLDKPAEAEIERLRASQLPSQPAFRDTVYAELLNEGVSSRWYMIRGEVYLDGGRADAAASQFSMALKARPDADAHNNLGLALQRLGRFSEAARHHRAALELRPGFREALINLGSALFQIGEVDEAIASAERAKELDSSFPQAYVNLGIFYSATGRVAEAIYELREGLASAPFDIRIANRLAWLLATSSDSDLRDGAEAVRLAETVCEITDFRVPESLDVLGAAYAEIGEFGKAVTTARRAHELAVGARREDLAERIQSRLALYEAERRYRIGK